MCSSRSGKLASACILDDELLFHRPDQLHADSPRSRGLIGIELLSTGANLYSVIRLQIVLSGRRQPCALEHKCSDYRIIGQPRKSTACSLRICALYALVHRPGRPQSFHVATAGSQYYQNEDRCRLVMHNVTTEKLLVDSGLLAIVRIC